MIHNCSFENNKIYFTSNSDWKNLLSELDCAKNFIDSLGFLTFGRDMRVVRSVDGIQIVSTNQILQSAAQTLHSMAICAKYGNVSDVHVLLRKLRDDLFFYLYVIVVCTKSNLISSDILSRKEEQIDAWRKNELSHLSIGEIIRSLLQASECQGIVEKYDLAKELEQVGKVLNNYTHGNGIIYYNRLYTHYFEGKIRQIATKMIQMLNYIIVTFIFVLVLLCPGYVMAYDYIDALDCSTLPEEGSQYWVAPFVTAFVEKHKDLLGTAALEYLRKETIMEI